MKSLKNSMYSLLILVCFSCTNKAPEYFTAEEIGWKIEVLKHWKIESKRKLNEDIKQGEKLIQKTVDKDFELGGKEISLITFRKNLLSKFQASIIPFKENYKGEWNDKYPLIKEFIFNVFKSQDVQVDSTSSKENINGVNFEVFNLKISKDHKLLMEQNMYRTYINGYDFIVNMTSDKPLYKIQLLKAFRKSEFTNRKM